MQSPILLLLLSILPLSAQPERSGDRQGTAGTATASAPSKPRVFILTDIENEPDDTMSMVRLLVYANHFDIEGFVATTSIHQRNRVAPQRIRRIVEA
jgi:hypothetical protein